MSYELSDDGPFIPTDPDIIAKHVDEDVPPHYCRQCNVPLKEHYRDFKKTVIGHHGQIEEWYIETRAYYRCPQCKGRWIETICEIPSGPNWDPDDVPGWR